MPRLVNIGLHHNNERGPLGLRRKYIFPEITIHAQKRTFVPQATLPRTGGSATSRCGGSRRRGTPPGDLSEGYTGRNRGIERLDGAGERDPNAEVAGLADQSGQA